MPDKEDRAGEPDPVFPAQATAGSEWDEEPSGGHQPRVLVCLDRTELGERGLHYAITLAKNWNAHVILLHVLEPPRQGGQATPWSALDWEVAKAEARAYLERIRADIETDLPGVETKLLQGHPAEQIGRESRDQAADVTVISTRGERGLLGWNLGRTSQIVVTQADGSLLIIPPYVRLEQEVACVKFRRIAVALDGSLRAECGLPMAARIARDHDATLTLYHVVRSQLLTCPSFHSEEDRRTAADLERSNVRAVERYFAQLQTRLESQGVRVTTLVQQGSNIQEALTKTAIRQHLDLLVISAHGRTGGCGNPYGSITQHLIGGGMVPLLILQDVPEEKRGWGGARGEAAQTPGRVAGLYREETT